ncbi:MAG: YeeE/YedE family protein [Methanomicrobiales archaeon 53_19]|jgi:xanthosine utilization system XapX-like protein|uniref:DUF6691 family protein n=1 Tax=Methanocalculus sp. TaxID=2004547 RepID=UPI000747604A|nr:DUF6691 family protein [Methanocalculus sp.]KUK69866.1 MAG: YeeE/YedE family protein [Methanocalculus sp. 52_23]KUL04479.1 MAG: YeeE/YedE family protein [Methanomicrobiales archaeon 53_19]HIJ07671.1 YeeE/YedE family protein [Methanocalculus sp.]
MAFDELRANPKAQVILGLIFGIIFGFLLQKGGVTNYDVILGQLLLTDFTVVTVIMTAILVGMIGIYIMKAAGLVHLHIKLGSVGATIIGGLIFGAGFAILGYCPGTAAAAVGSGALDALVGMIGIVIGAGIFARLYPRLDRTILNKGVFPAETIPELLGIRALFIVPVVAVLIVGVLYLLQMIGF